MRFLNDNDVKQIVVLGSKPKADLPFINARVVIAANGAVELGLKYRKKFGSYLIGLVPLQELYNHKHICDSFMKAQPDEIVVMGGNEKEAESFIHDTLNLRKSKIITLSFNKVNWEMVKLFGWSRFMLAFDFMYKKGLRNFIRNVIPDLIFKREFIWMHRSTGLGSILYSLQRFPEVNQIVVGGIGLIAGGHFNEIGEFTSKTARADQITIKHWPEKLKKNISITDKIASEISGFKNWSGEVFIRSHD